MNRSQRSKATSLTTALLSRLAGHRLDRKATLAILVIGSLFGISRAIQKAYDKYQDEFKPHKGEIADKFKKTFFLK